jgi:uncharacterized protein YjcR
MAKRKTDLPPISREQLHIAADLAVQGVILAEISKRLGVSHSSLKRHATRLGWVDARRRAKLNALAELKRANSSLLVQQAAENMAVAIGQDACSAQLAGVNSIETKWLASQDD